MCNFNKGDRIRKKTERNFAFTLILLLFCGGLFAAVRPEIQSIALNYEQGNLEQSRQLLQKIQPLNSDEQAIVYYYKALLASEAETAKQQLLLLIQLPSRNNYVQKGLLELGQISLLERDYDKALTYFNRITDPDLPEKHFWLASAYYSQGNFSKAVASADQFIRLAGDSPKKEDAYLLLADAYISLGQYNNAINTLKKLLSKPELVTKEQYLRYRYGYATEMLGNTSEAVSQYRQGIELNRASQLAYLMEDRLFDLRDKYGSAIDLSFLYPYSDTSLPDIVLVALSNSGNNNDADKSDSMPKVQSAKPQEVDFEKQTGIYLQAGRFSNQQNAIKLCERILKLNLNAQYYKSTQHSDVSWVVIVGPYTTELDAVNAKTVLRQENIDSFIIQN